MSQVELERFDPQLEGAIAYEHLHRYALCGEYVAESKVLDLACGDGYGSVVLARTAASVTGVDLDGETIERARSRYSSKNIDFIVGDATDVPLDDQLFDVVVSFETIEHVKDPVAVVREIRRLLKPGGLLIISSPNRPVYNALRTSRNEFHLNEMDLDEFSSLLSDFTHVQLLGQRLATVSLMGTPLLNGVDGNLAEYLGFTLEGRSHEGVVSVGPGVRRILDPRIPTRVLLRSRNRTFGDSRFNLFHAG